MLDCMWDPYHMLWNALKRGLGKARGKYWRSMLLLQTRCNVSYGPWGHHDHKYTRQDAWHRLLTGSTFQSEWFQENLAKFAFDMDLTHIPRTQKAQEALFSKVAARGKTNEEMGPLTSINRWFSILGGLEFHDSEWTLECISVQKLMEQRLRRPMNETETRLVWPNAGGGKKTPEGEVKALREANNKETINFSSNLAMCLCGSTHDISRC